MDIPDLAAAEMRLVLKRIVEQPIENEHYIKEMEFVGVDVKSAMLRLKEESAELFGEVRLNPSVGCEEFLLFVVVLDNCQVAEQLAVLSDERFEVGVHKPCVAMLLVFLVIQD